MNAIYSPTLTLPAPPTVLGFARPVPVVASGNYTLGDSERSLLRQEIEDFNKLPNAAESAADLASVLSSVGAGPLTSGDADALIRTHLALLQLSAPQILSCIQGAVPAVLLHNETDPGGLTALVLVRATTP